ncbi:alpha/beta hydrolase family protein [Polaribacter uvawellassae]|uniref:alpha/beta hydrolase family protein n=1 Tax=Polaribacter uvawellassae TaxID=3133495 RepID=UPI003219163B
MRTIINILILFITVNAFSQKSAKDFGYRHFPIDFKNDTVHIIVKSKKNEEQIKKPIFIFIQGSLAKPVLKYNGEKHYPPFPFSSKILEDNYHLIVINKPQIPYITDIENLDDNKEFIDKETNLPPSEYLERNYLDYYVERNSKVIQYLKKQNWVDSSKIVVAGHSEGSTIAVKMATTNQNVTHLIYSGGTPYYSRIMSIISQDREIENDSISWVERDFEYWQNTNKNKFDISREHGFNTYKGTYSFSQNLSEDFKKLNIPTLVSYGTKDTASPFNDLLRIQMIESNKTKIDFKAYIGLEHNYFPLNSDGSLNYNEFNWDKVAMDWKKWLAE